MKRLYYFYSNSCAPCKTMGPIMDRIGKQVTVQKVDTDYSDVERYNVQSIPTVILVKNDQEVGRFIGIKSEGQVLDFYNSVK